jgi:hypothetical protein
MPLAGILILLPLVIYLAAALTIPREAVRTPDDFFIAYRKVSPNPFTNSSIAYAFQVATVYPFITWGCQGVFLVPLLNALFWGLGILLFYRILARLKLFIGSDMTLHGFLGQCYTPLIRRCTSVLTIIGLLGVALAEIVWGSQALLALTSNKQTIYVIMFLFTFLVLLYISYGGQISSIRTDQLQLIFSYVGVFGLMLYFLVVCILRTKVAVSGILSFSCLLLVAYTLLIFLLRRGRFLQSTDQVNQFDKHMTLASNTLVNVLLLGTAVASVALLFRHGLSHKLFDWVSLDSFGTKGALALVLLPTLWQFVDMTNWQRILAVRNDNDTSDDQLYNIKRGLLVYAVESPFTWLLFLALGALVVVARTDLGGVGDIFVRLPKTLMASPSVPDNLLGALFVVSVLAIMLSTVDSVIMAILFTFVYDTFPPTAKILDKKQANEIDAKRMNILLVARICGLVAMLGGIGLYVLFDTSGLGGDRFIGVLFSFYTAQLAMAPAVAGAVFLRRRPVNNWLLGSVLCGAAVGICIGLYATVIEPAYQWDSILWCLGVSCGLYGFSLLGEKRDA